MDLFERKDLQAILSDAVEQALTNIEENDE